MKWIMKFISICMVMCLLLCLFPVQSFAATGEVLTYEDRYGQWQYVENGDDTVTITAYKGSAKHVVVPAKINGMRVVRLGDGAFKGNETAAAVAISYGIESIGKEAFAGCKVLETVTIPTSVKAIEDDAFSNCEKLVEVRIPESVTEFGESIFQGSDNAHIYASEGSAAAEWLTEHQDEISVYTLYSVTPAEEEPIEGTGSAGTASDDTSGNGTSAWIVQNETDNGIFNEAGYRYNPADDSDFIARRLNSKPPRGLPPRRLQRRLKVRKP